MRSDVQNHPQRGLLPTIVWARDTKRLKQQHAGGGGPDIHVYSHVTISFSHNLLALRDEPMSRTFVIQLFTTPHISGKLRKRPETLGRIKQAWNLQGCCCSVHSSKTQPPLN
jgi:hypothetical protein